MTDELLRYRSQFPILDRTIYLISNSLGAMPNGVYNAMKGYADTWATRGVRAWEEKWWMLAGEVGDQIGALMNAPPGSISTHQNVTTCEAVVASCFNFSGKRNKIVYTDMDFPSVMYFWEAQRGNGAQVPCMAQLRPRGFGARLARSRRVGVHGKVRLWGRPVHVTHECGRRSAAPR